MKDSFWQNWQYLGHKKICCFYYGLICAFLQQSVKNNTLEC